MNRTRVVGVGVVLILTGCLAYALLRNEAPGQLENSFEQAVASNPGSLKPPPSTGSDERVDVGGVRRSISDLPVSSSQQSSGVDVTGMISENDPFDYGTAPPVAVDANPQVEAVVDAIREKRNFEMVSTLIPPKAFDAEAFSQNPKAYVNRVEPGRVFQVLQPEPGTPALRKDSPRYQEVKQGESVYLRAIAPPGAPVTFTSLDLGVFENQLTSVTVLADADGVAEAAFTGTTGTINDIHIVAGSPMTSGNVTYIVNVKK